MEYSALYKEGEEALRNANIEDASLDARLLLEFVCGTDHNTLLSHGDLEVSEEKTAAFRKIIDERKQRIPVAYLLGKWDFMGLEFDVTSDVLIPNQDTETLVEEVLKVMHDGMRLLDLCTGSGCIALSLLHYSNDTTAVATDISEKALAIAERNAGKLGLTDRFDAVCTDIFPAKEKFDIVVSNPPYIPTDVINTLAPEVKEFEPYMALDGSADGLEFYRKIIPGAKEYLYTSGYLFLEIGYDQGEAVSSMMKENGYRNVEVIKDLGGNDRVVMGCFY